MIDKQNYQKNNRRREDLEVHVEGRSPAEAVEEVEVAVELAWAEEERLRADVEEGMLSVGGTPPSPSHLFDSENNSCFF